MTNNWKVGDQFWIDYKLFKQPRERMYYSWFPPEKQPYTVKVVRNNGATVECEEVEYIIDTPYIYNKNKIVTEILKDL